MHVCLREMTAGILFSSGPSATTVRIKKDLSGSFSCFINNERLLQTAPTSKLVLQYQAMVLAQIFLTDYSGVSSLRILGRAKQ